MTVTARRTFGRLQRVSIGVIGAGLVLLVVMAFAGRSEPTGPIYSTGQVLAALDAAQLKHHTNPQSAQANTPNDCSLVDNADRKHVREQVRTQLQVGADDSGDVDLVVIAYDRGGTAVAKARNRRAIVAANGWVAAQNGNLYVEIQAPTSAVPAGAQTAVVNAVSGIATPASPAPPLLHCS